MTEYNDERRFAANSRRDDDSDIDRERVHTNELSTEYLADRRRAHRKWARRWRVVTGLLIMTFFGIPLALFTGLLYRKHTTDAKRITAQLEARGVVDGGA
jgi:hypothetical protein